jgi:hypothetical protein
MDKPISFTSLNWTVMRDHWLVMVATVRDLAERDTASLIGGVVTIDGSPFVVRDVSPTGKTIPAGRPTRRRQ